MKLFYTLFFAFLSLSSWSQTLETELSKTYSKEEIAQFKAENSLPLYEYALTHACYLIDAPQGKDISQFEVFDLLLPPSTEPIVFTNYSIRILDRTQYYRVINTNKILVVKSKNILSLEMQTQKK
jgi:hypothetical protein